MEDAKLERYIAQVAGDETTKAAKIKADEEARGVVIRPEMTPGELEAFKHGGHQELAKHQKNQRQADDQAVRDRMLLEELEGIEPEDEASADYTRFHGAKRRELDQGRQEREEAEKHAEIKRLLAEIHAMVEPEVAQEKEELDRQAHQRFVQSQALDAPTPEEERVAAALDFEVRSGGSFTKKEELKNAAIDKFIGEAAREQVTIDEQTFSEGQEVVYTDRKGNRNILKVHIPEGLAKGSLALTGMIENKQGKMQRVDFAIDREAVKTRVNPNVEAFLQEQHPISKAA